jgi:DNA-binding response OmpR family regulator
VNVLLSLPLPLPELAPLVLPAPLIDLGALTIDVESRRVEVAGRRVVLAPKEFELLLELASAPNRVFRKNELLRTVWGFRSAARTRTLDSHACRLRRKLEAGGSERYVVNEWGYGYRLLD